MYQRTKDRPEKIRHESQWYFHIRNHSEPFRVTNMHSGRTDTVSNTFSCFAFPSVATPHNQWEILHLCSIGWKQSASMGVHVKEAARDWSIWWRRKNPAGNWFSEEMISATELSGWFPNWYLQQMSLLHRRLGVRGIESPALMGIRRTVKRSSRYLKVNTATDHLPLGHLCTLRCSFIRQVAFENIKGGGFPTLWSQRVLLGLEDGHVWNRASIKLG